MTPSRSLAISDFISVFMRAWLRNACSSPGQIAGRLLAVPRRNIGRRVERRLYIDRFVGEESVADRHSQFRKYPARLAGNREKSACWLPVAGHFVIPD